MEVQFHANMVDYTTLAISDQLIDVFKPLSRKLQGDYGGTIEHLWIAFELIASHTRPDGKPRFPFRFQKRVSGRSSFSSIISPDYHNVGHFSVRPDFAHLLSLPKDEAIKYCLNLIYTSLDVLTTKEKKLGGFNSALFIDNFRQECARLGYDVKRI